MVTFLQSLNFANFMFQKIYYTKSTIMIHTLFLPLGTFAVYNCALTSAINSPMTVMSINLPL